MQSLQSYRKVHYINEDMRIYHHHVRVMSCLGVFVAPAQILGQHTPYIVFLDHVDIHATVCTGSTNSHITNLALLALTYYQIFVSTISEMAYISTSSHALPYCWSHSRTQSRYTLYICLHQMSLVSIRPCRGRVHCPSYGLEPDTDGTLSTGIHVMYCPFTKSRYTYMFITMTVQSPQLRQSKYKPEKPYRKVSNRLRAPHTGRSK